MSKRRNVKTIIRFCVKILSLVVSSIREKALATTRE